MCTKQFVKSDNRNGGFNGFKVIFYDYNYELGFVCQSVTRIEKRNTHSIHSHSTFRWLYVVMKRVVIKTDAFFLSRLTVTIIIYFIECGGPVDLYTNRNAIFLTKGV